MLAMLNKQGTGNVCPLPENGGGDENPPLFSLTMTQEELTYLHDIMNDEVQYNGEIPEILSLFIRISRLNGETLTLVS